MANLIVYDSRKGQNYWNGSIVDLAKGNTERVAEYIQKAVGGDLFKIEIVREYSKDYMTCTEEAKAELREGARPELKKYPDSVGQYDTLFVGYSNGRGTMPMCVYTFLEHYDLTGTRQNKKAFIQAIMNGTLNDYACEDGSVEAAVDGLTATVIGKSRVVAAVFGSGKHTWRLKQDMHLVKKDDRWRITPSEASTC